MTKLLNVTLLLSQQEYDLFFAIAKAGRAEYRDTEFETVNDFKNSGVFSGIWTLEWFMERNFNGTFYLINGLLENHLIEPVEEAWHSTYKLSDFGRKVMTFNKYENV